MGKSNQPASWRHSREFESPSSYFSESDVSVGSFDELTRTVDRIQANHRGKLLWRGQENSAWGLHSSLFRTLAERQGTNLIRETPTESMYTDLQRFPDEDAMVQAEARTLDIARREWRFDSQRSLEILARIHHHGGPTRLIDFSFNPYIAAWFATAEVANDGVEGRLFALATHGPNRAAAEPQILLDEVWGGNNLPWHAWNSKELRNVNNWGNGSLRRFWVPRPMTAECSLRMPCSSSMAFPLAV
ncbi:FRG domain-containing protein [Cryobacterium sp. TMT4-10]|uniref:FRG domain-containing protein n=1 Tax=Cryobacterium sp. TMT4-10 TaxID=1259256 RepID=UPI00141BF0DF